MEQQIYATRARKSRPQDPIEPTLETMTEELANDLSERVLRPQDSNGSASRVIANGHRNGANRNGIVGEVAVEEVWREVDIAASLQPLKAAIKADRNRNRAHGFGFD